MQRLLDRAIDSAFGFFLQRPSPRNMAIKGIVRVLGAKTSVDGRSVRAVHILVELGSIEIVSFARVLVVKPGK
jgi:hypothetical protein